MASYHVYFSPRKGVSSDELIKQVHLFMATQVEGNFAETYRILRMTDKASFESLPDFHLIVDYPSGDALLDGFNGMKEHFKNEPHSSLMRMVSDFKVAFSEDETPMANELQ